MSRLYNTFEFIGNIQTPKSKDKFHEVNVSASGWEGHRLNFAVQESKTNSVYVEMYGGFFQSKKNNVITFGKGTENEKGSKLEIPWEDRLNPETIDMVADFKKIVVDFTTDEAVKEASGKLRYEIRAIEYKDEKTPEEIEKLKELKEELKQKVPDRYEFIHEYDAVEFLSSNLENFKAYKFKITGQAEYSEYKGKFNRKFKPEVIEIVPSDTPSQLRATFDIFFTKDALDEVDFEKEKKIYIGGYVISYDKKVKKDMFYPQQFIINASKVDMDNEMHVKRLEFLKNKFKVTDKGVYHLPWIVNIFRGADQVEFTFEQLTPQQKEAVEFGYNKLEDFAPKNGTLGETKEENRLVKPILQEINGDNNFINGAVLSLYEEDELVYVFNSQEEKPTEAPNNDTPKETKKVDIELDDLFA
ncbi:hypothetical protein A616_16735 [Brevibacillus brevis X23]|nr:hypothetical protein A616_16735 [Brevibacillus brevis X23]